MKNITFEAAEYKNNYVPGAVGAVLGAIIGAVPWALVSMAGWFVGWLGAVIGFLAKRGYEFFGGKPGRPKIGIICGASIFGVILGCILPDLFEFGQLIYKGEIEAAYTDIPLLYFYWVKNFEVLKSVLTNLGLGLVFGMLGISSIFREVTAELKPAAQENTPVQSSENDDDVSPNPENNT